MLSLEETIGLAYGGPEHFRHVYSKANPDALPELRGIFRTRPRHGELHYNVAIMIGYIGDVDDVYFLSNTIEYFEGDLFSYEKRQTLLGIFEAWSVMSRRGINEADEEIRKWCTYQQWDEVLAEEKWLAQTKYEYAWQAIRIYGRYSEADWQPLRDALLKGVEDEEIYKRISSYLSDDSMTKAIERRKELETGPVTEQQRDSLRRNYESFRLFKNRLEPY